MIQLSINQHDHSFRDTFDSKTFWIRQEIFEVMNKYRKDNEFNGYLDFSPEGIRGPSLTSVTYGSINPTINYSVISEEIDIEKELEADFHIAKEVNEIIKKHYDMELNRVGVTYFERNGFDFESYLEQYKKNNGEGIYGIFEKADYHLRLDNLEQFKDEANRNYNEQYKKADSN